MAPAAARQRGLRAETLWGLFFAGVTQIATALTYLVAARGSSPAAFGAVVAAIGMQLSAIGVIDFGAGMHTAREMAAGRMLTSDAMARLRARIAILALVSLVLAAISWRTQLLSGIGASVLWVMAVSTGASLGIQAILRGLGMPCRASSLNAIDRSIGLTVIVIGLTSAADLAPRDLLLGAVAVGPCVATTVALAWIPDVRLRQLRVEHPYRGTVAFGITSSVTSVNTLDASIVSWTAGAASSGEFGAVSRWVGPLNIAVGSYAQTIFATLVQEPSMRQALKRVLSTSWILLISWLMAFLVAILSPWIVGILLGAEYSQSAPVLAIISLATIPSSLSQVALVLLQTRDDDRGGAGRVVLGVAVQLGLVAVGSAFFGSPGAALAILVTQILLAFLMMGRVRIVIRMEAENEKEGHATHLGANRTEHIEEGDEPSPKKP